MLEREKQNVSPLDLVIIKCSENQMCSRCHDSWSENCDASSCDVVQEEDPRHTERLRNAIVQPRIL